MTNNPASRQLSRPIAVSAALCLVVPAALNVTFHILSPVTASSLPAGLAQAAAHPQQAGIAASLQFALPVLAIGVLVLAWRASAGAPRLAVWGGAFLAGGYLLGTLAAVDNLLQAVVPSHTDPGTALRIVHGFESGVPGQLGVLALVGQAPGLILMGLALWRSRVVPRVLAGCFVATLPLHILTHTNDDNRLPALSWGWFVIVLVGCSFYLIRDAWADTEAAADTWSTRSVASTMSA